MLNDTGAKCDSCSAHHQMRGASFSDMIAAIKKLGWRVTKRSTGWGHYCAECVRKYQARDAARKPKAVRPHWQD